MRALRNALREYVAVRRALGTQLQEPAMTLGHFVEFLEREGAEFITTELALRWAREPEREQRATWARRLSMVRRFAAWLSGFDQRTEVPPRGLIEARHQRTKPHIFTQQEIEQLMAEESRLPSRTGLRALIHVTLIGLLAATGLRPGEALALDVHDVNLQNGVLAIRQTKFGKSRFVPLDDSTSVALAHYAQRRDELCPRREAEAFLVSERGTRLDQCATRRTFAKLSCLIGLRTAAEGQRNIEAIPELLQLATEQLTVRQRGGTL